jgi:hypothetical protein
MAGLDMPWPELDPWGRTSCAGGGPVCHANIVMCRPPHNKFPSREIVEECWRRHEDTHQQLRVSVPIIAAGENARRALSDHIPVEGITEERGGWWPHRLGGWFIQTIHPAFIARGGGGQDKGLAQTQWLPMLVWDIEKALQGQPGLPTVRVVGGSELSLILDGLTGPNLVAIDLEGRDKPTLVGLSWDPSEAWVAWYNPAVQKALKGLLSRTNILSAWHNAEFDLLMLQRACEIPLPHKWIDTIVMAGVVDPSVRLGLQSQVLAHLPESLPWKGLVDHRNLELRGQNGRDGQRLAVNKLRAEQGRNEIPLDSHRKWYAFYNGLDAAWTRGLVDRLSARLGHRTYYQSMCQGLQRPLLELSERGLPIDAEAALRHRARLLELERQAYGLVERVGEIVRASRLSKITQQIELLERQRAEELVEHKAAGGKGKPKFSRAGDLTKLRTKVKSAERPFNVDSYQQRVELVVGYLGLELPTGKERSTVTTDDKALESLLSRVQRGTLKPKNVPVDETLGILQGMVEAKKWAVWRRTFVDRTLRRVGYEVGDEDTDRADRIGPDSEGGDELG